MFLKAISGKTTRHRDGFDFTTEQVRRYIFLRIYIRSYYWLRAPPACQFDWSFFCAVRGKYDQYHIYVVVSYYHIYYVVPY